MNESQLPNGVHMEGLQRLCGIERLWNTAHGNKRD